MKLDMLLADGNLVFPGVGVIPGSVGIKDGRIAALLESGRRLPAMETIDCKNHWILPGVIDPHVHFGFGSPETDFLTESRSAALGGVTSVISFHRSNDLRESMQPIREKAARQSCIDFGFHFGITSRLHVETLKECALKFGVSSFKLYLMYKGKAGAAKGFTEIDDGLLFAAMQQVAGIKGGVLGVHCENVEVIPELRGPLREAGRSDLRAWDEQSPDFLEAENVHRVCYFGSKVGCPVTIVHLSSQESIEEVRRHRRQSRSPVYVETCPHYLFLTREASCGVLAKMNPPLRSRQDIEALWEGVMDGTIDTIATDHVPRKRATKEELWTATNGIPGVATLLPILIHEGVHKRGVPIERIAALTSQNAARIYNLPTKGEMAIGKDADLVVVDPELERVVEPSELESFSDYSPYEGMTLKGWPVLTLVRGRKIAQNGKVISKADEGLWGQYLVRL